MPASPLHGPGRTAGPRWWSQTATIAVTAALVAGGIAGVMLSSSLATGGGQAHSSSARSLRGLDVSDQSAITGGTSPAPLASRQIPSAAAIPGASAGSLSRSPSPSLSPSPSPSSSTAPAPSTSAGAAPANTGPITGKNGLCVDVRRSNTADFTPVQVFTCNQTSAQQWTLASNGTIQALGKCLGVHFGRTVNGTTVDLFHCNNTGGQVWQRLNDGSLFNPQSGKCLDDTNLSATPGTQLQVWSCTDAANQHWALPGA
jgi:hypothetical protein